MRPNRLLVEGKSNLGKLRRHTFETLLTLNILERDGLGIRKEASKNLK